MKTLVKIDRNGSKHYIDDTCPRCGGSGKISYYGHVDGGRCFMCNGSGKYERKIIERTPEYDQKLADRRLEKAKAKAPSINENFFKKMHFSKNGDAYIVLGNTYEIKEDLKAAGAHFNYSLGWYFDHEQNEYPYQILERDSFMNKLENDTYAIDWQKAEKLVKEFQKEYKEKTTPKSTSEFVGEVGEVYANELILDKYFTFTSNFGYHSQLNAIYKFKDIDGNVITWKTSYKEELYDKEGKTFIVKGRIKNHNEYKGEKQTELTRCKIREVR